MMSFRGSWLKQIALPPTIVRTLCQIHQSKGRLQGRLASSSPSLAGLAEAARIGAVAAAGRLSGLKVEGRRVELLASGRVGGEGPDETQLAGYARALGWLYDGSSSPELTPDALLRLHSAVAKPRPDEGGDAPSNPPEPDSESPPCPPFLRRRPVSLEEAPTALSELIASYRHVRAREAVEPLVLDALLILDFLCIYPYRSGNEEIAQLVARLALQRNGFAAGRYVSLETLLEDSLETCCSSLLECSGRWLDGRHRWIPWVEYYLGLIARASRRLEERSDALASAPGAKTALVVEAIEAFDRPFTLRQLHNACPGVSRELVRRVLRQRRQDGEVDCLGKGPGARWRRIRSQQDDGRPNQSG